MASLEHKEILKHIKQREFLPVYLLHGEEPYFTDVLAEAFENHALPEHEKAFDQMVLYGQDINAGLLTDTAMQFPMMAGRKLILVKEAQEMPDMDKMEPYLRQPSPATLLVLAFRGKKLRANSKVFKRISEIGAVFESKPLYQNQVAKFISDSFKEKGRQLESGVADLLAEYLGTDLVVIRGAIDKLLLNVDASSQVSAADVESHIGISRQYNVFEFQDALTERDWPRVSRIGYNMAMNEREQPLPLVIASLYGYFSGLFALQDVLNKSETEQRQAAGTSSSFRLQKMRSGASKWPRPQLESVLLLLDEFDMKSKGVEFNTNSGSMSQLCVELTQRILAVSAR